tara:strand:+ start:98 stop:502 length:405 start_codon:yes stop_codon:yes gene_type:complete
MSSFQIPKNKFLRLLINVVLIVVWIGSYVIVDGQLLWKSAFWYNLTGAITIGGILIMPFIIVLIPIFFTTRYIWFEKSRNRIFYGLFNKFRKFQPRIYTTTSNADELKKYAELRDKGIITEEEFQSKKKKLLDL